MKMSSASILFVAIIYFSICDSHINASTTTTPAPDTTTTAMEPKTCDHHSDFSTRLSCISGKYHDGVINSEVANMWTQEALRLLDQKNTYYSAGIVLGTETKIVVSRQESFAFDWSISIPLAIYNAFSDDTLLMNDPSDKPMLIYTDAKLTEMQTLPDWSIHAQVPDLSEDVKPLYRHEKAKGGMITKNCANFEQWKLREFVKDTTIAIIMPSNFWCPESATAFDVYIASILPAGEKEGKRVWFFDWYREKGSAFGNLPDWATETHFQ